MTKLEQIIEQLQCFLHSQETVSKYRLNAKYFTRASKCSFKNTVLCGLYRFKGSLDAEIYNLMKANNLEPVTKGALSQNRYKIDSAIYVSLNKLLINSLNTLNVCSSFNTHFMTKTFHGFGVQAVDGSKITLPNTAELQEYFGTQQGGSKDNPTQTAMCLLMCCYDVLNNIIVNSQVDSLTTSEQSVAKSWVQKFDSQSITLFDRGFPSVFFCYCMLKYNKPFVIRAKVNFNKVVTAFYESDAVDSIVHFVAKEKETLNGDTLEKGTSAKVRLVKIVLPNGKIEILITSLFDDTLFTLEVLNELYQLRWTIETAYNRLKNQLLIMIFSGLKPEAIYQDIYATIFIHNLQQIFINEAQVIVNEETINSGKEYKVNNSIATSIFKFQIIPLLITTNTQQIIKELIRVFVQKRIAKSEKNKSYPRGKSMSKRRNLVTQLNFKRAA